MGQSDLTLVPVYLRQGEEEGWYDQKGPFSLAGASDQRTMVLLPRSHKLMFTWLVKDQGTVRLSNGSGLESESKSSTPVEELAVQAQGRAVSISPSSPSFYSSQP